MTLKECYAKMGADYEDAVARLVKDKLIFKYNKKFCATTDFELLVKHVEEENYEEAFRDVHSIKGVSVNLAFTKLFQLSSELCEILRGGGKPDVDIAPMVQAIMDERNFLLSCIEELDEAE